MPELKGNIYTDLTFLKSFADGDDDFVKSMVSLFIHKMPLELPLMMLYAQADKWPEVKAIAHKMKSTVNFMGMPGMKERFQQLEIATSVEEPNRAELLKEIEFIITFCHHAVKELQTQFGL